MSHVGAHVPLRGDLAWRDHAKCVDQDPGLFTPEVEANASGVVREAHARTVLKALKVCGACQVSAASLADAYATGDRWTIRGGTTGEQRVAERRRQASAELRQARARLNAGAR